MAEASTTFGDEARTTTTAAAASTAVNGARVVAESALCPDCACELRGEYCHACGEKRVDARDLTVKHFVADAAQEVTSLDSKLLLTLKGLLFKPGFLTLEWLAGRRNRYLKPLNLCLAIFALTVFAYSAYKPVSTYDVGRILAADKTGQVTQLLDKWAARKNMPREALADSISDKWQQHISLLQILVVVALAVQLQIMFIFTQRHFVEHLIFSLHFVAFTFLLVVLLWPVYLFVGIDPTPRSQLLGSGVWLLIVAYLFFAVRAVYRLKWVRALVVSFLLLAGYFISYVVVYAAALIIAMVHAVKF